VPRYLPAERHAGTSLVRESSPRLAAFLDSRRLTDERAFFELPLHDSEGALEPGETVLVRGRARWEEVGPTRARTLTMGFAPGGGLIVSDDPAAIG
jgi:hypothetical protein